MCVGNALTRSVSFFDYLVVSKYALASFIRHLPDVREVVRVMVLGDRRTAIQERCGVDFSRELVAVPQGSHSRAPEDHNASTHTHTFAQEADCSRMLCALSIFIYI